uniref:Secreted protein n=1 Tax=Angiostrongylus cantonensis TaxID=6313 RepID=A0A158P6E6_ANGCA
MDELLAIIVIVILCCVMFFAWLVSMATCPDAMVSFLSGSSFESSPNSSALKIGIALALFVVEHKCEFLYSIGQELVKSVSSVFLQLNSQRKMSDKKLSVVPEADEQLTVQSTIHSMRPSILRAPSQTSGDQKTNAVNLV